MYIAPDFIGQSSESILQRTSKTFDKSLSARKGGWEHIIVQAFGHTDQMGYYSSRVCA